MFKHGHKHCLQAGLKQTAKHGHKQLHVRNGRYLRRTTHLRVVISPLVTRAMETQKNG